MMQQKMPEVVPGHRVGTWCQWGAIIIVILGVIQLFILIAQNQPLLPILGLISGTIFSALVLYAVGVIVKYHAGGRP
jgi:hypothetical protein